MSGKSQGILRWMISGNPGSVCLCQVTKYLNVLNFFNMSQIQDKVSVWMLFTVITVLVKSTKDNIQFIYIGINLKPTSVIEDLHVMQIKLN